MIIFRERHLVLVVILVILQHIIYLHRAFVSLIWIKCWAKRRYIDPSKTYQFSNLVVFGVSCFRSILRFEERVAEKNTFE